MMRPFVTGVAICALAASSAMAMNAPKPAPGVVTKKKMHETALQLMDKMGADGSLREQTSALISQQTASLSQMPCAANAAPEVRRLMEEALDVAAMRSQMAEVYAANFTLDELTWMLDFYETPLGKKWIAVQPQISRTMTNVSSTRMKEAEPKIAAAISAANKDGKCQLEQQRNR